MMPSANCGSLLQGNQYRQNVSVVFHSFMFDFIDICIPHRLYSGVVRKFPSGSRFVEVGCWKGRSAIYMAIEIMNAQKNIRFDCVDTWEGSGEHSDVRHIAYDPIVLQKDALFYEFMNNTEPYRSISIRFEWTLSVPLHCMKMGVSTSSSWTLIMSTSTSSPNCPSGFRR